MGKTSISALFIGFSKMAYVAFCIGSPPILNGLVRNNKALPASQKNKSHGARD